MVALTGSQLRALTRATERRHGGARLRDLFGDLYTYLVVTVVTLTMLYQAAGLAGAGFDTRSGSGRLAEAWIGWLLLAAATALGAGFLLRIGPVGVGGAGAVWWLPTPADRTSLLRPRAIAVVAASSAVGMVVGTAVAELTDQSLWQTVLLSGGIAAALGGGTILAQTSLQQRPHRAAHVADVMLAVTVLAWVGIAVASLPAPAIPLLLAAAVVAVVGIVLAVAALVQVGSIPGAALRAQGARGGEAAFAIRSLDLRSLGRLLAAPVRDVRRRSSRLVAVVGRRSALVAADGLLLVRSPSVVVVVLVALALPVAVAASRAHILAVIGGVLAAGVLIANASAAGARSAHFAPMLDRVLGLSAASARLTRLIPASALCAGWAAIVVVALGALDGGFRVGDLGLALLLAPGLAAAGSLAAYRKPPDFTQPLVVTPYGVYQPGMFGAVALGPTLTLVAMAPTLVAVGVAAAPVLLLVLQALVATALVLAVGFTARNSGR